ncbi:ATP-binding protein [Thiotrichales bacterium HSG1]|nr:ATP-binding protein [Thiotrichales bacterium HSG1]
MVKYFTIQNFSSIKEENILEFDTHKRKNFPASSIIGIAGANASGKTSVLQALTFIFWFMQHSFLRIDGGEKIPYQPYYGMEEQPTVFHLIFSKKTIIDKKEKLVDYEYTLHLLNQEVIREELYHYPYKRKRKVYIREKLKVKFGKYPKESEEFDTKDLRIDCSLISLASRFASQIVAIECMKYFLQSNLRSQGSEENTFNPKTLQTLMEDKQIAIHVQDFIKIADFGIHDIKFGKIDLNMRNVKVNIPGIKLVDTSNNKDIKNLKLPVDTALFIHKINDDNVIFPSDLESSGTIQFLIILSRLLKTINDGGLLIIDEIEIKLHQNLVAYLIGLFQNENFNSKYAQFIFSFHNSFIMNLLEPEQLWSTEKNELGETEIFSADDFNDISNLQKDNLEQLYKIGRFGAVPRGL